ncbi:hypothetical protein ILUMI_26308 [Ignelater luminosus]|uniref:PiggyBac transposable element-derived protein domain-containing protein n=1 Tax=Ignelater luminosus TaxID=2038154 RepID=A0A8K0C6U4_IGNLU|nr:hypothetical protein ILUMI_26308 [Ignelater luminosus]
MVREAAASKFRRMTYEKQQEYIRQLANLSDSQSDVDEGQVDKEFIPQAAQHESSAVEDVFENSENRIELEDENSSDNESEGSADESSDANCLFGKDKTVWHRTPPKTGRVRKHNILREKSGPTKSTQMLSICETFKCIFSDVMCNIIIRETNRKANSVYAAYNVENLEILQKFGNPLHLKNANPLYRAAKGLNRFWSISRFLRFDNANSRANRLATDKAAAITDIFNLLNANLRSSYSPSDRLTVDEQGRTRFTQFMPSRPAKYGIKVWWVCNARNPYPLTGQIYTGKVTAARETNQGERVVKDLCHRYKNSGRNVTMDNFFTSLPLARLLLSWNLTVVGTLKRNKPYIPPVMLSSSKHEPESSVFGFSADNVTICRFLKELGKQLSMPAILMQSKIPNVYRTFLTRLGIECVLGTPLVAADSEKNPDLRNSPPRDATSRRKVKYVCWHPLVGPLKSDILFVSMHSLFKKTTEKKEESATMHRPPKKITER